MKKFIFVMLFLVSSTAQAFDWTITKSSEGWTIYRGDRVSSWYINSDGFTVNLDGRLKLKSGECGSRVGRELEEFDVKSSVECSGQTFTVHLWQLNKEDFGQTRKAVNPANLPAGASLTVSMAYDAPPAAPQQPSRPSCNSWDHEEWSSRYGKCVCTSGYYRSSTSGRCMKEPSDRY
jgi:hypothetical protein